MRGIESPAVQRGELIARQAERPRVAPRIAGERRSWIDPREEVLDISVSLFVDRGFAAISTRDIAEAVGIRQASIYYRFPSGKDDSR